ncbi:hypothetical protein SORDD16_01700 [Streptococcus oralis]|uniref:Uncharacterized protein n=1 Tax=Streptococcus oralis TaxID=1303 RepID=A0A139P9K6_STROR|nr:hypothetical protein SORDD16_01700 [Streptococcus oralis]
MFLSGILKKQTYDTSYLTFYHIFETFIYFRKRFYMLKFYQEIKEVKKWEFG